MANYPIEDRVFQEAPFPKTFPFSRAVPRLYAEIRQHVNLSYGFVEDLGLSNTDVDDMVRQATNHLLSKVLSSKSAVMEMGAHLRYQIRRCGCKRLSLHTHTPPPIYFTRPPRRDSASSPPHFTTADADLSQHDAS